MPYITTMVTPRKNKVDILDFLDGFVTLDMLQPPSKHQKTVTRTYYYDTITPQKLEKLNISKQIELLESFYKKYGHMDVCNGNPHYDYELQVQLGQKYKRMGVDELEITQMVTEDMKEMGLKYLPLYSTFFIPKSSSTPGHMKWRRIDAPCEELKKCLGELKQMFEVLMGGCYYHTSAFAYISGRCAKDAVQRHAQKKSNWFLKLDFSNFFGSITPEFLIKMFSNIFPFSEIVKLERGRDVLCNCLNLCFLNGGLPQGTPMSPILTNIMMIPIDHQLSKLLRGKMVTSPNNQKHSFTYTRYADDIVISNRVKFDPKEIVDCVKVVLEHWGAPFKLNDDKTRYGSNAGENWILGVMLNQQYNTTVGYKRKKRLKSMLSNYMLDRKNGHPWCIDDVYHLQGEIAYCKSIEPDMINHIIREYSAKYGDIHEAIRSDIRSAS